MAENQGFLEGGMPLLVQYLAAAGQDIGSGNPIGANVNAATQQNLKAQSMTKMLQKLLAGGGKMTMDSQNVNIKAPVGAFSGSGGSVTEPYTGEQLSAPAQSMTEPVTGQRLGQQSTSGQSSNMLKTMMAMNLLGGGAGNVNPPSSPLGNITAADLVGLTPQDISQALALRQHQDAINQEEINNQYSNMLTLARIQGMSGTDSTYPVPVPGLGTVSETQWKSLPSDIRSYAAYVYQSKQANPGEPVMSLQEFKTLSPNTQVSYLKALQDDPSLMDTALKLRKAGATTVNVGEKVEVAEAMQDVKDSRYYTDPSSGIGTDLQKYLESRSIRSNLLQYEPGSQEYQVATMREVEKFYEKKFEQGNVEVLDRRVEGRDFVWKVRFPNGKVKEVRYGN